MKTTKQGVRDLNHLPSKPKGIILPPAPAETVPCKHSEHSHSNSSDGDFTWCDGCGQMWDWDGNPTWKR